VCHTCSWVKSSATVSRLRTRAEHNYDECVKLLSEIIAKQPRNTDAFNNRGLAYADLKQFEKAIQDYNQAISNCFNLA
jgi:tetratricopeptide (TPR) repeat protein